VDLGAPRLVRLKREEAAVGGPERTERTARAEREPGADAALEVPDPDVGPRAPRVGEVEREPVAAWREGRAVTVARVPDGLSRNPVDRLVARAVEQDDPLGTPGAVSTSRGIADLLRWAARDLDLLELALREEREEPAVGRPERPRRAKGARTKGTKKAGGEGRGLRGAKVEPRRDEGAPTLADLGLSKKDSALAKKAADLADSARDLRTPRTLRLLKCPTRGPLVERV
jgi:hypothetical protein